MIFSAVFSPSPGIARILSFKDNSQVLSLSESLNWSSPSNCSSRGSLSSGVEVEVLAPKSI